MKTLRKKWGEKLRIYGFSERDDGVAKALKTDVLDFFLNERKTELQELVEEIEELETLDSGEFGAGYITCQDDVKALLQAKLNQG